MYIVTFKWYDKDVYCTNLSEAANEGAVKAYYEKKGCNVISVRKATDYEIQDGRRKGMPVSVCK